MHDLESKFDWLSSIQFVSLKHEGDKVIVFERGNLVWIFNFHPTKSFSDYRVGTAWGSVHRVALHSDRKEFGGHERISETCEYFPTQLEWNHRPYFIQVHKIVSSKNSKGISVWFLLLGGIGSFSTVGNVVLLQMDAIHCCTSTWTPYMCFENTLGVTQVASQCIGFSTIIALFFVYYPTDTPVDSGDLEGLDAIRGRSEYRRVLGAGVTILLYALFVLFSITVILNITDQLVFLNAKIWWAGVLGIVSTLTGLVQFVPQIVHTYQSKARVHYLDEDNDTMSALSISTIAMQCPGSFALSVSLALQPGTNWTSWISYFVSGILLGVLLVLCILYRPKPVRLSEEVEPLMPENTVHIGDGNSSATGRQHIIARGQGGDEDDNDDEDEDDNDEDRAATRRLLSNSNEIEIESASIGGR
eukprot:jgi/Hompol1/2202/HPOL_005910-RA